MTRIQQTLLVTCTALIAACGTSDRPTTKSKTAVTTADAAVACTCPPTDPVHTGDYPTEEFDPSWLLVESEGSPFVFSYFDYSKPTDGDTSTDAGVTDTGGVSTDSGADTGETYDADVSETEFYAYMMGGDGDGKELAAAASMADLIQAVMQLYLDGKITREQVEAVTGKTYDKKNKKWVELPKDKWEERIKAFKQSDIADILAMAIIAKGGKNYVWGDIPGLGNTTASWVLAAIIMEAAAVGKSIGEWIADKLEDIAKSNMCNSCTTDLLDDATKGAVRSGIWTTTYGADYKAMCVYDSCTSKLFVVYFERTDSRFWPFSKKNFRPKVGKCNDFKPAG
jgi:hypothetical protein